MENHLQNKPALRPRLRRGEERGGIILNIILVIAVLIALGYYGLDLEKLVHSPIVQKNFYYVWHFVAGVWHTLVEWIKKPFV